MTCARPKRGWYGNCGHSEREKGDLTGVWLGNILSIFAEVA